MWRTRPCDRRDPGTGNGATNSKLPRPSIKAASDHAGPLRTPFPSRRLRFLKPRQVVVCLVEPRSTTELLVKPAGCPPKTLEFPSPQKPPASSFILETIRVAGEVTSLGNELLFARIEVCKGVGPRLVDGNHRITGISLNCQRLLPVTGTLGHATTMRSLSGRICGS